MKRTLAALTAVTLALGLSLATVAGPASAVARTTPPSTPAPVSSANPTPTTAPTATPSKSSTPAPTASAAPAPAEETTVAAATASEFTVAATTNLPKPTIYETIVWSMASGKAVTITDGSATYPQVGVAQYKNETTPNLNVSIPDTCGVAYQVDVYVQTEGSTDNTVALDALFKSGLQGPNGAQDGKYLVPGGLGTAWKYQTNAVCVSPVCIPNSAISYHYNANDDNNGYVVVTDVPHSTGALCNTLYVTATSWKFTTSSSVWPQNRDIVDKLDPITAPGTYKFAAKVTCGQGDIYASFSSTEPSLNPGPVLNGSGTPFHENFLSGLGLTGATSPTYTQDNPSCFIPVPETGTPTAKVLSCTAYSSNSLTLPAVPGGVWTVTSAHYSHTYTIGTGITGYTPSFFEKYTIVLSDGSNTDGYVVTGNTSYWTPVNPQALDCNTKVTPTIPTANSIVKCGDDGSIVIPSTTGVTYKLDGSVVASNSTVTGLTGDHTVTATTVPGYEFAPGATVSWTFHLGALKTCDVSTVVGTCTADGTVSSVPVSLTLDNTSGNASSTFEVKIEGTTYDHKFTVPANTKVSESIGSSTTAGEKVDVFINKSATPVVLAIDAFDGCVPVTPGDPTFTPLSCTGTTTNLGSISTDGNPELIYTLHFPNGTTQVFGDAPNSTIGNLPAGDYSVTVVAKTGFLLQAASPSVYPVDVPLVAVNCVGTQQSPVVTFVAPTCQPNRANAAIASALSEVQGKITIPNNPNMTFTISNGTTTSPITAGTYIEPDGTYTIVATLTSTAIADGYTFGPSPVAPAVQYTTSANDTVATFANIVFVSSCGLPTLASWHSGATGTPAVCTSTGQSGTIALVHGSDSGHPTDETGKVTYTLVNNANGHTTNLGSTALTVNVRPGSYTVEAVPTDPADGLVGNPNARNEIDYPVLIAAAAAICGDTSLAFTGGTIAWAGFVLAGGMLFLGIAFLLIRRRNGRTAE